uniref:RWD domain-containing protein 3 n=1 Tax=Scleropages formosus TaxID=113540 RepID=A0A8C9R8Q7_SCLFO
MSERALEEIAVLSAIYCGAGQFEWTQRSDTEGNIFHIQVPVGESSGRKTVTLLFHLPAEYPSCVPGISVSCEQLTRRQCEDIKQSLLTKASALVSEPMVHELVLWLQQNAENITDVEQPSRHRGPPGRSEIHVDERVWTALLLIDHMRSKAKYIKTVEKWTWDLELTGRLFTGQLILLLLQGTRRNIKEYLHLHKSVKVDVDSAGKKCKEKMMSVLCERPLSEERKQFLLQGKCHRGMTTGCTPFRKHSSKTAGAGEAHVITMRALFRRGPRTPAVFAQSEL